MTVAVCILLLASATVPCLYYFVLYVLGRCRRAKRACGEPFHLTVIIPAHDEAEHLPTTIRSVFDADYPLTHLRVLVVADNCTDRTAEIATIYGADCLIRHDPTRRGKGYALAYGLPQAVPGADAVIVLDADCTVNRDFFRLMSTELHRAEAVQAAYISRPKVGSPAGYVAAVGCAIDNAVAAGCDRVGLPVPLRGTGMGFRRGLLERHPWDAFGPTEDAEYTTHLLRGRVPVRYLPDAHVYCHPPTDGAAFHVQRRRWSAALRVHPLGLLGSKPLVLAHLFAVTLVVTLFTTSPLLLGWLTTLLLLTAGVYLAAAVPHGWPSFRIGGVVLRLLWLALTGGKHRNQQWERTPRG